MDVQFTATYTREVAQGTVKNVHTSVVTFFGALAAAH
jgi:hypothetical protein